MSLEAVPREVLAAIAALAALWLGILFVRGWLRGVRLRRRFARGAEGEREAVAILERHGYAIEGAQVAATYAVDVDGEPTAIAVRADYLVVRRGERFVAEVKTGAAAPRIDTAATRRQLLEYQHAFEVSGVLLVDADAETVQRVAFR